jgi:hypothetical protein
VIYTPETWLRQRGTFATTAQVLVRDLGMRPGAAQMALSRLARRRLAVRICPGHYIHTENQP